MYSDVTSTSLAVMCVRFAHFLRNNDQSRASLERPLDEKRLKYIFLKWTNAHPWRRVEKSKVVTPNPIKLNAVMLDSFTRLDV